MGKFLDAALNGAKSYEGKAYFFKGAKYCRYDWAKDQGDSGYPLGLDEWGFPSPFDQGIDAAIEGREGYATKAYFFKDDKYLRYDWVADKVDEGPTSIIDGWGIPAGFFAGKKKIDAAVNGVGDCARYCYLFSGTSWVRIDWQDKDPAELHKDLGDWKIPDGMSKGVDAALSGWGPKYGSKTYFFLDQKYARYDWIADKCDLPNGDLGAWKVSFDGAGPAHQGAITNSKITVGDKKVPFMKWFADTHIKTDTKLFPHPINKDHKFAEIFDNIKTWIGAEIPINQFIALFLIMYNETGGWFQSVSELGHPDYMFNKITGKKKSYNTLPGNIKAGDALVKKGILDANADKDEVAAWNGEAYPAKSKVKVEDSNECDFFKLRGRGLIQTTGRGNYVKSIDPALKNIGYQPFDKLTEPELGKAIKDPKFYLETLRLFFGTASWKTVFAGLAGDKPNWKAVGGTISGSGEKGAYAAKFEARCTSVAAALAKAGWAD
jgi:hypothetical protein